MLFFDDDVCYRCVSQPEQTGGVDPQRSGSSNRLWRPLPSP